MKEFMFVLAVIFAIVSFFVIGTYLLRNQCYQWKTVLDIGGCNKSGYCGVKYTDGSFGSQHMPVIGQSFEVPIRCPKD